MKTGAALAIGASSQVLGRATCLCETCLAQVPAEIVANDTAVSYVKNCPIHGVHGSVIATDPQYFLECRSLRRTRMASDPHVERPADGRHSTMMAIVEVTESCNARCPTCSAASSPELKTIWSADQIRHALDAFKTASAPPHDLLMVSGGEPTLHPDLIEILENAHATGFHRVMLITNGLRIARERAFAANLAALGPWLEVYLQFDSLDERVLRELRGEDLREVRLRALEHLESYGIATTLVSVVKNGLNQDEVGAVVDFALTYRCIRGVTFQPLRAVGRTDGFDPKLHRLTLTDVRARLIDTGRFDGSSLRPHPSSPETVCIGYLSRSSGQPRGRRRHPLRTHPGQRQRLAAAECQ